MKLLIRYNTEKKGEHDIWRVIWLGLEFYVAEIQINTFSKTSKDVVKVDGKDLDKYHISCEPQSVCFSYNEMNQLLLIVE